MVKNHLSREKYPNREAYFVKNKSSYLNRFILRKKMPRGWMVSRFFLFFIGCIIVLKSEMAKL